MKLSNARGLVLIVFVAVLSFVGGYVRGGGALSDAKDIVWLNQSEKSVSVASDRGATGVDLSLFWNVWRRLADNYLDADKIDTKKMVYGAIKGMTASLSDPYTVFLPPTENTRSQEDLSGEFNGVGIQLGYVDSTLAVMAPLPDHPAIKAGVKAGDLILRIKDDSAGVDTDTKDMSLTEAVNLIRGKKGSSVKLTLYSKGSSSPREVELVRDKINIPSVELSWVGPDKNVAHLRVMKFGEKTLSEWKTAVEEISGKRLSKSNFGGVVLDLRNNPGGYLQAAVDLASEFIPDGVVVQQEGKNSTETFSVSRNGRLVDVPVVVLVNGGSASASEILSGALRERVGAKLVGDNTFGKGTVQEAQNLPNGAGLHVTIARWLLPSGLNIHGKGLAPDVEVSFKADLNNSRKDNQVDKAVEVLLGK